MPLLCKALYQRTEGGDEDRWRLAFDTEAKRLFVEHEIKRGDTRGRGYSAHTDEHEIGAFLNAEGEEAPQRELMRVLTSLFEEHENTHRS